MRSHYPESGFFVAGMAGYHDVAPVDPYPHVRARNKERIAMVTVLPAEFPVHPHTLTHGNLPGKQHIAVASFRMIVKCTPRLPEEYGYSFPGNLFGCRVFGSLLQEFTGSRFVDTISVMDEKTAGTLQTS